MQSSRSTAAMIGTLLLATACGGGNDDVPAPGDAAADAMTGTAGMPGMQMGNSGMMDRMSAHMAVVRGIDADSLMAVLPTHRQLVANMIAQMNREMRDMQMATDAAWDATVDSLRSDLTRMPELSEAELEALMPAHDRRVLRLLEMHTVMMSGMGR